MSIKWFALRSIGLFAMFLGVVISTFLAVVAVIAAIPVELGYRVKRLLAHEKNAATAIPLAQSLLPMHDL